MKNKKGGQMTNKKKHRFLLGALVGATAGVLLAPKSGKETRNDIKKGGKKAYKKARTAGAKTVAEAKKVKRTVSRDAKKAAKSVGVKKK
ncbi:YtxH domain-containing protein [Candidatus Saccharibacteria bacterium]|nr:YtxH domain-containing protein [Candidatus Saccharibacteria bacterium]